MEVLKQSVGIDVDSKKLKVCFRQSLENRVVKTRGSRAFNNTLTGFKSLVTWITKLNKHELEITITLESTGVYHENLIYYLTDHTKYHVQVIMGSVSNFYLKSLKNKSKTDKIDAAGLAQFGLERHLKAWTPVSQEMRQIKKISRERCRLVRECTIVKNQLHAELASYQPNKKTVTRYKQRIKFIDKQMDVVVKSLKSLVSKNEELKEKLRKVETIIGVGFITAITVIAELNEFKLFTNRSQVVSYCGYDVVVRESGTSVRGKNKISKKGNSYVRGILYLAAMSACRHDAHHKAYSRRIIEKTSLPMKGNVAIQRKLLLLIYTLFKNETVYDVTYADRMREIIQKQNQQKRLNESLV